MADQLATKEDQGLTASTVKGFMALPSTKKRVEDLLGDRSSNFMTSVSTMIGADDKLSRCEPISLFMACLTAAALDLPINKNLGFAHIIPYDNTKLNITEAQFQLGWRGYVQLAMRTGKYKTIAATPVYEGQLAEEDPLEGNTYAWKSRSSDQVIGYVARFTTINGFQKEIYMSQEEVYNHAVKYSKAYAYDLRPNTKYKNSPWSTNFDAMALKTVIKQLISKWGIMSIELEKAIAVDSAVVKEDGTPSYIDGELSNDLDDVKASDDQKRAIIEANTGGDDEDDQTPSSDDDQADTQSSGESTTKPKLNVKEEAAKRWSKPKPNKDKENLKQAGLLDDASDN